MMDPRSRFGYRAIDVVDDSHFAFAGVQSMQPSGVLHECPFPEHRQSEEQRIESRVIEPFPDVPAGRKKESFLAIGN